MLAIVTLKDTTITIIFIVIIITGVSYILAILTQWLFDNLIKKNYDLTLFKIESEKLNNLRVEVIDKLKKEKNFSIKLEMNDFLLFQTLWRVFSYYNNKSTNTSRYATDAKVAGIATYQYIKSKYRSRAFRLYINYLLGDKEVIYRGKKDD